MSEEQKISVIGKIKGAINRLPFNNLVAKVPALAKFSGYVNYAASVLILLIVVVGLSPSTSVKPAVNELKKVNNEAARFWIHMIEENGIDAISDKKSLIGVAVENDNYDLVKACIKSGANVNLRQPSYTPITVAAYRGNTDIVELLIKNKAALIDPTDERRDVVDAAIETLNEDIIKLILPRVPKSEINFLDEQNKRQESYLVGEVIRSSKKLNIFINLINNYGYRTKEHFGNLLDSLRFRQAKDLPELIKAIKNNLSEKRSKTVFKDTITNIENMIDWRYASYGGKFDKTSPEEIEVQKQINELISWLEKEGYERKSK